MKGYFLCENCKRETPNKYSKATACLMIGAKEKKLCTYCFETLGYDKMLNQILKEDKELEMII